MSACHQRFSALLFVVFLIGLLGCDSNGDHVDIEDSGLNPFDDIDMETEGELLADVAPCRFDVLYLSEGRNRIFAEDSSQSACFFSIWFAEFDPDSGALMEMISPGDTRFVRADGGFMIASVDFTCSANSSGICTADRGTATIVTFEPSFDDVQSGDISGRAVLIQLDAEGTKPGQRARYVGIVEGAIP